MVSPFAGGWGWMHARHDRATWAHQRARPRHPGHQTVHLTGARRTIRRRRTDLRRYNAVRSVSRRLRTSPPLEGARVPLEITADALRSALEAAATWLELQAAS